MIALFTCANCQRVFEREAKTDKEIAKLAHEINLPAVCESCQATEWFGE